jgi:hypothetical protein
MAEPHHHANQPPVVSGDSLPKLEYGRQPSAWRRERTPEEQRRGLMRCVAVTSVAMFIWMVAMFWTRRPALDYFCICGFLPLLFALNWPILGWQLLTLTRRYSQPHRRRLIAVVLLAFFLGPYSMVRAGCDMFTLSVRYHLWRAGGAEKVRAAFNQWVASQPPEGPGSDQKMLFTQLKPGGNVVPLPLAQLPPAVRYMNKQFPSRFGMVWKDVADLDNVYALTTTDILIGPPGWEPDGGETLWNRITGNRRKLADGIWVQFGLYDK